MSTLIAGVLRAQRLGLAAALALTALSAHAGQFRVLHSFDTARHRPVGGLTAVGNALLGTTAAVFTDSTAPPFGTIFSLDRDGSDFQVLHEFAGPEGSNPEASMTLVGPKLIGTTGGPRAGQPDTGNFGTLFSINPDGTHYQVLHEFQNGGTDVSGVRAPIVASGSKFFGTAEGAAGGGHVFSTNDDGSNLQLLHAFSSGDGANPSGSATQIGSTLYGITRAGGTDDAGVVYSIDTDGSNFQVLHEFAGSTLDGGQPAGELTLAGSKLYGTTFAGGAADVGTVWSMNVDGSDYEVLHSFADLFSGGNPRAGLTLHESTLYGAGDFALFSIGLDGAEFETLHPFNANVDGFAPHSQLVLIESTLYGTAVFGGAGPNAGTVFAYTIPEPTGIALAALGLLGLVAVGLRRQWR